MTTHELKTDQEMIQTRYALFDDDHILFVHEEISRVSAVNTDHVAVVYEDASLTYRQLEVLSNKLAHYLIDEGIEIEDKIGVCVRPGIELPVIILGILKAGAAYVPLMPTLPLQRVETILKDSDAVLLLTNAQNNATYLNLTISKLVYNLDEWIGKEIEEYTPKIGLQPEHTAYVLYTSGSTGKPKGVVIEHRNLSYYLGWTINKLLKDTGVKLPLTSSMSFAAGVTQLYSALLRGESLHILPADRIRQPALIMEWYTINKGCGLYCVPTLWNEILNWAEQQMPAHFSPPQCLLLSGEAIPETLLERTFKKFPEIRVWNLYGPTEAVANFSATELLPGKKITIGNAIPGTKFFVVKDDGSEALNGETGELLATNNGLARGYLGQPGLTEAAFITYTSEIYGPVRAYRTGDLVKVDEEGLSYQGRLDQQVKIRGYRIELMEVELTIKKLEGIAQAVVKSYKSGASENMLVGYIVTTEDKHYSIPSLRKELSNLLPDYMIPERWVFMNQFPTLPNGKINRKQLPEPDDPRPQLGYLPVYASSAEEQGVIKIFEETIGFNGLGMHDNFFDLGGTSLKINAIVSKVQNTFNCQIFYRDLFEYPTPSLLLQHIKTKIPDVAVETKINEAFVLAPNQEGMWFIQLANKNSASYNIPYSIRLRGVLDTSNVKKSLQGVVDKHLPLRSSFVSEKGLPKLMVKEQLDVEVSLTDLGFMLATDAIKHAINSLEDAASEPFDISQVPLFKFHLYRLGENDYLLGLIIHHILFDGWSINVFHEEFISNYLALIKGDPLAASAPAISYLHFANEYQLYENTKSYQNSDTFWQQMLRGAAGRTLVPYDFTGKETKRAAGGRISFHLGAALKEQMYALNRQQGVTPFMTLLSCFISLLQRYTNEDDLVIGAPVANRTHAAYSSLIGYFVNTLMLRVRVNPKMTFSQLLKNVKEVCLESFSHSIMPFHKQLGVLRKQSISGQQANIHILFAYHEAFEKIKGTAELSSEVAEHFNHNAKVPLALECQDTKEDVLLTLTYDKSLYHEQSMLQFMNYYILLLKRMVNDPDNKLSEYSIQTEFGKLRLKMMAEGEHKNFDKPKVLHKVFEEIADAHPEQTVIRFNGCPFTYKQLEESANILSRKFESVGFGPGDAAGIFMNHSPGMIAAMLGVMKCGGYYVPLDPSYPEKRNSYVIEHAKLRMIVLTNDLKQALPATTVTTIEIDPLIRYEDDSNKQRITHLSVKPDDLIYTMYTSGSTGNPKGVMVPHKGVCNLLLWMKEYFGVGSLDNILAKTSISFDISVPELFLPILSGGVTVLSDRSVMKAPEQIAELIKEEKVTIAQFVPSGLKAFSDVGVLAECTSLKKIWCTGEVFPLFLQQEVLRQFKGELYNLYGPTECCVYMCYWLGNSALTFRTVPIGRPINNSLVYVLDKDLRPLPEGMTGEIYIGGEVLAKGYLYNEQQTTKVFIPSPFFKNTVIYKTGDLGRFLYDGTLEYMGRIDHQVKVRGYRIELGEIEQLLSKLKEIKKVVVTRKEFSDVDVRLVAYIVLQPGASISESAIRSYLKNHLPDYMLPSTSHFVDDIPVLPNGKTDINTLHSFVSLNKKEMVSPSKYIKDDIEKILAGIWEEVLGKNDFKLTDNFMDAGGHSILLVRVCELINERLQETYTLLDLFQFPNIRSFAKHHREKHSDISDKIHDRIAKRRLKINEMKKRFSNN